VNPRWEGLNYSIAPTQGFDVARFLAEAKAGESTWDFYVGVTPFVEMAQLVASGTIEPWDPYIPKDVLDDMLRRSERSACSTARCTSGPSLLDVIVEAQNNRHHQRGRPPRQDPGGLG